MFDPTEIVILVPILRRPHLIEPLIKNVAATTPAGVDLIFLPDPHGDDESVETLNELDAHYAWSDTTGWAGKINEATKYLGYRYLFCCADDVIFHRGWLDAVMQMMGGLAIIKPGSGPDTISEQIQVVGTLDNLTSNVMAGEHATHFMVDRQYIDTFGGVIDEGPGSFLPTAYRHNYTDTEFIETAKARGVFAPSAALVEHAHFLAGAPFDETYRIGEDSKVADSLIFEQRRHLWEGGVK